MSALVPSLLVGRMAYGPNGLLASVVDGDALLEMTWTAVLAGLGVTAIYAIAIFGAARAVDSNRSGRTVNATVFGALSVVALLAVAGAVIFGIVAMTDK